MSGPVAAGLDGGRVHFQHGPIDLVIEAQGEPDAVRRSYDRAWQRFQDLLPTLAGELPLLRSPVERAQALQGPVARRMLSACWPYRDVFITPMAAVAGSVADEIMASLQVEGVRRAYVNNGGDIALYLAAGESFRIGVAEGFERIAGEIALDAGSPVRGVATSGWRGRSFSLGIADSVTVLARTAAQADAAATIIANAVDVEDAAIGRRPACDIKDDSDLGELPVTVSVGALSEAQAAAALDAGQAVATRLLAAGLVCGAALFLQGQSRIVGVPAQTTWLN